MEIEIEINRLIKKYRNHLAKCELIMEKSQGTTPMTYYRHQEFQKFWNLMLNDLIKLSEIVRDERYKDKSR